MFVITALPPRPIFVLLVYFLSATCHSFLYDRLSRSYILSPSYSTYNPKNYVLSIIYKCTNTPPHNVPSMKCKPSPSYSYHPKNYVLSISYIHTITELHTIHDMHTVTELLYTYHAWAPTSMSSYELQYNSSISYILYSIPALYIQN